MEVNVTLDGTVEIDTYDIAQEVIGSLAYEDIASEVIGYLDTDSITDDVVRNLDLDDIAARLTETVTFAVFSRLKVQEPEPVPVVEDTPTFPEYGGEG